MMTDNHKQEFREVSVTFADGSETTKLVPVPTNWDWAMRVMMIIATIAAVIGAYK